MSQDNVRRKAEAIVNKIERLEAVKAADLVAELTPKQSLFVQEYLIDLNATQAAIRAGYSKDTAYSIGQENLKKPEIEIAIQAAMDKRAERTGLTADRVLQEIESIAFANIQDHVDYGPGGVIIKSSDRDAARALSEVSQSETLTGTNIKVKLHDKLRALELAGKHLKLFTDQVDHSGTVKHEVSITSIAGMTDEQIRAEIKRRLDTE